MKNIYYLPSGTQVKVSFLEAEVDGLIDTEFGIYFDGMAVSGVESAAQGDRWIADLKKHGDPIFIDIADFSIEFISTNIQKLT